MEKNYDKRVTDGWLDKSGLSEQFETEGMDFFVICYQQGEFLSKPGQPMECFQFLVRGSVALYYLDESGTRRNVTVTDSEGLLGDMEFALGNIPFFFSEAVTPVTVLALPMEKNRARLEKDCRFLLYLLRQASRIKIFSARNAVVMPGLEERLLYHLKNECPHRRMTGMENTAAKLQCSRRQLQRVVGKLVEQGRLVKRQRGCYQLVEE